MTASGRPDRWLHCRRLLAAPRVRLVCFAYAGGAASVYHAWPDELPADVEVRAVQLPGRQDRLLEPTVASSATILDEVTRALAALPPAPLACFGHSFGGLLAFELARRCRASATPAELVIIGARPAPHLPSRLADIHQLAPPELFETLHRRYGMSRVVIDTPRLQELILPALRADLTASETHRFIPGAPLDVPLVLLRGRGDSSVEAEDVAAWREHSTAPIALHEVDAGHFFVETHRAWLLPIVAEALGRVGA